MKLFTDLIKEEFTEYRIKDVKVVFDVEPSEITFEIPEGYGDSELTIYIGDRFLKSLPADESVGKTKLGINYENINDAYFEYESVEPKREPTHGTHTHHRGGDPRRTPGLRETTPNCTPAPAPVRNP